MFLKIAGWFPCAQLTNLDLLCKNEMAKSLLQGMGNADQVLNSCKTHANLEIRNWRTRKSAEEKNKHIKAKIKTNPTTKNTTQKKSHI